MTKPTLFVSGAAGKLGRLVVASLLEKGYDGKIIAGTRDPGKLAGLEGVEVRRADFTDKAGLVKALAGVDRFQAVGQVTHHVDRDVVVRRPVEGDHGHVADDLGLHVFTPDWLHRLVPNRFLATTHLCTSVGPS